MKAVKSFFKNLKKNKNKYLLNIKKFIIKYKYLFIMAVPFIFMDLFTRIFSNSVNFFKIYRLVPNLFTLTYIILFVGITISFKKKIGKWLYLFFVVLFMVPFLTNNIYYSTTGTFFDFSLMESASEGAPYIMDTVKNANIIIYIGFVVLIVLTIIGIKSIPKESKTNWNLFFKILVTFVIMHAITPMFLGSADKDLTWSTWKNPRNIYISFNDNNKSMRVTGLYEYTIRNFYVTFLKTDEIINEEELDFLSNAFADDVSTSNSYTGKYKGKNLIFLQLEGIDSWLLTKENTPTLYSMKSNAINFNNHYSYYNGGGSTFNSEFAVNTGFITPLSYTKNAYTFNKNYFPYSMPNIFKELGYQVNAFHMNTGEYYSRTSNYLNWGFDNYYGLIDMFDYTDNSYKLDRELILNTEFSDLMFPTDSNFVDYIITYSVHMPFDNTNSNSVCSLLYETKDESIALTEEECARLQAKETDYMVSLLLAKLKEKGLYDNTVIVVYSDHYLYTLEDKTILDNYKTTSNNLINNTPCFIWSSNTKKTNISKATSQLNILPTILNLYGISYNPNNYIEEDALSKNYRGIVFFSDYSWYDGNVYVENAEVTNGKSISKTNLGEKNYYVSYITKKNDLALQYNYFKQKEESK